MGRKHGDGVDAHYKMCKKIAQLTKVIYQLNTQNEDYDARNAELRQRQEEELRTVCSEAEGRVEELRKAFLEEEEKRAGAMEAMQQRYRTELKEAKDAFARKTASMVDELSTSKARFEEVVAEVKAKAMEEAVKASAASAAAAEAAHAAKEEELERLKAAKEEEIANLVREYNERYKAMLAEQMDARDALEEQSRQLQSQFDAAATAHAEELQMWSSKLHEANEVATRASAELEQWKETCRSREADVNRLQQDCDTLRSRLDAEKNSLGVSRDVEATLRQEAEELRAQLKEMQVERNKLERSLSAKTAELAKAMSDITDLENQKSFLEAQQNQLSHNATDAGKRNQTLMSQVDALERRVMELQEAVNEAEREIQRRTLAERALEERCEELRQRAAERAKKHQDEIAALQAMQEATLAELHAASQRSNDVVASQYRSERDALTSCHKEELRRQQEQHNRQIEELRGEHEDILSGLRAQLASADALGVDLRASVAQLREQVDTLEAELGNARNALQEAARQQKDLIAKYEASVSDTAQKVAEMEATMNAKLDAERKGHMEKTRSLEAEIASLRRRLQSGTEASERNWEDKYRTQAEQYESQLEQLRQEHIENVKHRTGLHDAHVAKIEEMQKEEIRNLLEAAKQRQEAERMEFLNARKAFAAQLQGRDEELRRRGEELRQAQDQMDALRHGAKDQANRFAEELRAQKEYTARLTADCERLQAELEESNKALQASREGCTRMEKEARVWEGRERDVRQTLGRLEEASDRSRKEVEALHREYVASMEAKSARKMQSALAELRIAMTAERNAMQLRADEAIAALRQKCADLQGEAKSLSLKLDAAMHDLRKSKEELEREQSNREVERSEFNTTLQALRREFENEQERARRLNENHLNEVATTHKLLIDDLMQQHEEERRAQDSVIRELRAALEDLRYRYEYRESRGEDVAMINRLMKELKQKEQEMEKVVQDMKMYKLELLNREENYNKVFGRRPLVAVSASADKAPRLQQGARERGDIYDRRVT
ncbi:protein FAM184A [Trypanosoma conorhini]|uniref:Protein FAM184A n=1 Tax=Trypanosoma conorhini TaxID=83891 RepID=A0A3R7PJP5_9TRYP|nr:protein FAM184A [Trypanosoma conorhini]RNF26322.1 protein FAM184A [Trypanosoma conorhini]